MTITVIKSNDRLFSEKDNNNLATLLPSIYTSSTDVKYIIKKTSNSTHTPFCLRQLLVFWEFISEFDLPIHHRRPFLIIELEFSVNLCFYSVILILDLGWLTFIATANLGGILLGFFTFICKYKVHVMRKSFLRVIETLVAARPQYIQVTTRERHRRYIDVIKAWKLDKCLSY